VTVANSDHDPVPDLTVYAYDSETYTGISGGTDFYGQTHLMLPEGSYRFRSDQYDLPFWSNPVNDCTIPGCTTASVTVIGRDYAANDQTIAYTYDDLNRLTGADYSNGMSYDYTL
jgi:hypothetical protein